MKCEDCAKPIATKKLYSNEKWTVIESWIPKPNLWMQLAYRTIENIRQYRLLGEIETSFDVVYSGDDTATNKLHAYNEWNAFEERMWVKLG